MQLIRLCLLLTLLLAAGCTTTRSRRPIEHSPFLGPLHGFVTGPASTLMFKAPGVRWEKYTSVAVEPLRVFYLENAGYKGVHPESVAQLAELYRNSAQTIFAEEFNVVTKYDPGVLVIRAGLRGLQPTPTGKTPFHFSRSIMEYEVLDPLSGRVLAVVYRPLGHEPPRAGPWGRAESTVDYWNRLLMTQLISVGMTRDSVLPPLQRR